MPLNVQSPPRWNQVYQSWWSDDWNCNVSTSRIWEHHPLRSFRTWWMSDLSNNVTATIRNLLEGQDWNPSMASPPTPILPIPTCLCIKFLFRSTGSSSCQSHMSRSLVTGDPRSPQISLVHLREFRVRFQTSCSGHEWWGKLNPSW